MRTGHCAPIAEALFARTDAPPRLTTAVAPELRGRANAAALPCDGLILTTHRDLQPHQRLDCDGAVL
jgi:hypothetical protein